MITAIDSSVLWAILKQETGHETWLRALLGAASDGPLILCPVAFAELAPSTADAAELSGFLARLSISYSPFSETAAHLAGQTFKRYRLAGGGAPAPRAGLPHRCARPNPGRPPRCHRPRLPAAVVPGSAVVGLWWKRLRLRASCARIRLWLPLRRGGVGSV